AGLAQGADPLGRDVLDIGPAGVERGDLRCVDVESGGGETLFGEQAGQRQADIAEADDADSRAAIAQLPAQLRDRSFWLAGQIGSLSRGSSSFVRVTPEFSLVRLFISKWFRYEHLLTLGITYQHG